MSAYIGMPVRYEPPRYPNLSHVLAPEIAVLSNAEIRAVMEQYYGSGAAERYEEYFEGLFDDIGKTFSSAAKDVGYFAQKAAPVVANVGGGALQGALAGAALGPVGIIGGAALGGTGAALKHYGTGTARDVGGVLSGVTGVASQFTPLGRIGAAAVPAIGALASGDYKTAAGSALGAVGGALGGGASGQALGAVGGLLGNGGRPAPGPASALGALGALGGLLGGSGGGQAAGALGALGGLLGGSGGGRAASALGAIGSLLGGGGGGQGGAGAGLAALMSLFGGGSATTQLLSLLQRPETMQALGALSLGAAGRQSVPVGSAQTPVPVSAITNLIGQLANQASAEAAALSNGAEAQLQYMTNDAGEFVGDPAIDRDRAARLWDLLNSAQAERLIEAIAVDEASDPSEASDEVDEIAYYEALSLAEAELPEAYGEDVPEWDESGAYGYA